MRSQIVIYLAGLNMNASVESRTSQSAFGPGSSTKICRNAKRFGYYTPEYEWCEWTIKDKPIRYLTDNEEQRILKELDPSSVKDPYHKKSRQAERYLYPDGRWWIQDQ